MGWIIPGVGRDSSVSFSFCFHKLDVYTNIYRGLSAISGFIGAAVYPILYSTFGAWKTGQGSIIYQCTLVIGAASILILFDNESNPLKQYIPLCIGIIVVC